MKYLELEIPPDNIALVRQADRSLADAFEAQHQVNQCKTLGLYFNAHNPFDGRLKNLGLALVRAMRDVESDDAYETLQIRGTDPHTRKPRTLNLLEDFLIAEVSFVRSSKKARSIDSAAAFDAMEDAYIQRRGALEKSLRAVMPWD